MKQEGTPKKVQAKNQKQKTITSTPVKSTDSFLRFLFAKKQLIELLIITIVLFTIYFILAYLYPTPCQYYDTNGYIDSAVQRKFLCYRPFGYSWFLMYVKGISPTYTAAYFFQFLFNYLSSVFFIFTIKYIFKPSGKIVPYLFTAAVFCSPSILYMTNYILSDSIFISLTVTWITSCIWILYNKNVPAVILHFIALFAIIQVRYSGLFYPVFSVGIFAWAFRKKAIMAIVISLIPIAIGWQLYSSTKKQMRKNVGVNIFSGFSGWQLANNALHIIPYIDLKPEELPEPALQRIHTYALETPDSVYIKNGVTASYMWLKEYALKRYLYMSIGENSRYYLRAWVMCSEDFNKYGSFLIKKYPGKYLNHYLLPNFMEAIYPSNAEALAFYTMLATDNKWFSEKAEEYKLPTHDVFNEDYAPKLPLITFIEWLFLFASLLLGLIFYKKIHFATPAKRMIFFMLLLFGIVYMAFSIYASPFCIRYTLPIHHVQIVLPFILLFSIKTQITKPTDKLTNN